MGRGSGGLGIFGQRCGLRKRKVLVFIIYILLIWKLFDLSNISFLHFPFMKLATKTVKRQALNQVLLDCCVLGIELNYWPAVMS